MVGIKAKPSSDMKPKTMVLGFDGEEYPFVPGRNTARIVRDVRRLTGVSVVEAFDMLRTSPDVDAFLPLFVAAAMQSGVTPDVDALLDRVTLETPITVRYVDGIPDPEADGGS